MKYKRLCRVISTDRHSKMLSAYVCIAWLYFVGTAVGVNSAPQTVKIGCNLTLFASETFGIRQTFHLVNAKYGKVQRSDCVEKSNANCPLFASNADNPMLFVADPMSYSTPSFMAYHLRAVNEDGSYVKDGSDQILSISTNYGTNNYNYYDYSTQYADSYSYYDFPNDVYLGNQIHQVMGSWSADLSRSCVLTFDAGEVLRAVPSNNENGLEGRLVVTDRDMSYQPDRLWSFELATNTEAQFQRLDHNGDGEISLGETLNSTDPDSTSYQYDALAYMYKKFSQKDTSGDGFITQDEEEAYEASQLEERKAYIEANKDRYIESMNELIQESDTNNDGKLQLDEFKLFFAVRGQLLAKASFAKTFAKYDKDGDKAFNASEMLDYEMNFYFVEGPSDFIPLRRSYDVDPFGYC